MPEQEGQKKEFLGDAHIFPTEIAMYTEVLPKFQAILRAAGDNTILSVPCVYHSLKPRQVMVFEDMIPQGYHVVRGRDANVDELKAALTKLAKWQAVSYKVLAEQPELLDKCRYDLTEIPNFLDQKFITGGLPNFIEMLGQVPSLSKYQRYFDVMRNTLLKSWATTLREYRENQRSGTYYVLCHGDFHLRNMMFKNNKSTDALEDCMLLDFQICNVGPMTNDLMYAIYMLFSADNRKHNRDELVYHFFDTFSKTLQSINYKGPMPKLAALRDQMFERKNNDVLSKHENTSELKVLDVKISPASAKGDHYASVMFRGAVTYTCRNQTFTKSLIVKTMPEQEGHKKDMLGESRIFETEIGMYSEMLPKFEKILRAAGDNTVLHVPCLFYSLKPRKVMVFEDLVPQGYYVLRDRSMNIEELKCALSKLAKWHAVSFKLLKEDETQFASYKDGIMEIPNFMEDPFVKNGIDLFIRLLDKVPELKRFKPYFEQKRGSYLKELENVLSEYRLDRKPNTYTYSVMVTFIYGT
ncbi:uncharacterized protein LOC115624325 [Scaptodrosophila lebanonensis]|uniref:Uncharacterized protein LOC115624325 n=1 Tax=Drosophila lebanonensis TaxID=7225 RepID=A0A6J2TIG2_DROLE|nr:uncharacterized protein LOC115624325 [Scaptodrosophila lebanonensis]